MSFNDERDMSAVRKSVPGYPGWEADLDGHVWLYGVQVDGAAYAPGYVWMQANKRTIKRATLVCLAFHGQRPSRKHGVAHRNDIKNDDRPDNLRWATQAENVQDAIRNGLHTPPDRCPDELHARGESHGNAKLSDRAIEQIRQLYTTGDFSQRHLARKFGVCQRTIQLVVNERTWRHVHLLAKTTRG